MTRGVSLVHLPWWRVLAGLVPPHRPAGFDECQVAGTNNPAERRYLHVRPPETPRDYVTAQHAGTFVSSSEELHRWLEQLRHKFGRLPRTASMGHMTVHAWPCWPPIAARGHRRGRYRQLYLLHGESCRASLLRRQTVAAWAELPHLLHEARERRSA